MSTFYETTAVIFAWAQNTRKIRHQISLYTERDRTQTTRRGGFIYYTALNQSRKQTENKGVQDGIQAAGLALMNYLVIDVKIGSFGTLCSPVLSLVSLSQKLGQLLARKHPNDTECRISPAKAKNSPIREQKNYSSKK